MTQTAITIKGREYKVEKIVSTETFENLPESFNTHYILTGKRGAQYGVARHYGSPEYLTAIINPGALKSVVFTDTNGELEVVRA